MISLVDMLDNGGISLIIVLFAEAAKLAVIGLVGNLLLSGETELSNRRMLDDADESVETSEDEPPPPNS